MASKWVELASEFIPVYSKTGITAAIAIREAREQMSFEERQKVCELINTHEFTSVIHECTWNTTWYSMMFGRQTFR